MPYRIMFATYTQLRVRLSQQPKGVDTKRFSPFREQTPLSFQDRLCLIIAKDKGWTLVTNDRPLRKECEREGITVVWGIELVGNLVESGGLPPFIAKEIIHCIHKNNPKYSSTDVVQKAFNILGIIWIMKVD